MRLARKGQRYRASVPVQGMQRLVPLLSDSHGRIEVDIELGIDDEGIAHIRGRASTTLQVLCQRCLEPMDIELETGFSLGLVHSETQGERLPEDYDVLLMDDGEISLSDVIEDELLLAMPQVTLHDEQDCASVPVMRQLATRVQEDESRKPPRENPFAVLKRLKDQN